MDEHRARRRSDQYGRTVDPLDEIAIRLQSIEGRLSRIEGGIVLAAFVVGIAAALIGAHL